jgi:hypothetical protein
MIHEVLTLMVANSPVTTSNVNPFTTQATFKQLNEANLWLASLPKPQQQLFWSAYANADGIGGYLAGKQQSLPQASEAALVTDFFEQTHQPKAVQQLAYNLYKEPDMPLSQLGQRLALVATGETDSPNANSFYA